MHNERTTQSVVADYFYSARGGFLETSHKLMLKSLLYQTLKQAPSLYSPGSQLRSTFHAVRDRQPGHVEWTYSDLEEALNLLADVATLLNNEAFVFQFLVDAVDESEDVAERGRQRSDILRIFRRLATADQPSHKIKNFKIILISRPANAIERDLRGCHYIEVEKENRSDINKIIDLGLKALWAIMEPGGEDYVSDTEEDEKSLGNVMNKLQLDDFSSFQETTDFVIPKELCFIKDYLEQNASGIVLWVKLTLEELARHIEEYGSYSLDEIRRKLKALPTDLESLYEDICVSLKKSHSKEEVAQARFVLAWTSLAGRPMTVEEHREALVLFDFPNNPEDEFGTPSTFIANSAVRGNIIPSRRIRVLQHNWIPYRRRLNRICGCLLEVVSDEMAKSRHTETFAKKVRRTDIVQLLHQTSRDFLLRNNRAMPFKLDMVEGHLRIVKASFDYLELSKPPETLLHKRIEEWTPEDFRVYVDHLSDRPLLGYILEHLPSHVRQSCIEAPESFLSIYINNLRHPALGPHWLLLRKWCIKHGFFSDETFDASEKDSLSFEDVSSSLLLVKNFHWSCLSTAIKAGQLGTVRALLAAGVEKAIYSHRSALHIAAECGNTNIMMLLLEARNRAQKTNSDSGKDALFTHPDLEAHYEMGQSFVFGSGDFLFQIEMGQALLGAAAEGHEPMVRLLLDNGASINFRDRDGLSVLHHAELSRNTSLIRFIGDSGSRALELIV